MNTSRVNTKGIVAVLAVGVGSLLLVPCDGAAQSKAGVAGTFLIQNATVVTMSGAHIEGGSVLIQDGVIAAVGTSVSAPADAVVLDGTGKFVYPGMIDSYTQIGLEEIGRIATMQMSSELGQFNPHMRALVAVNTGSEMLGVTRSNGVTSAITAPEGGLVSGQAALINMDGWTWEDMSVRANAGYIVNYPQAFPGRRFRGTRSPEQQREGEERVASQLEELHQELMLAKAYHASRENGSEDEDLIYESLRPLIAGEAPAIVNVNSQEEIEWAIALAEEFDIRVVIHGGNEAWKVRDQLAASGIPVVLGAITSVPPDGAPYDAIYAQPGVLYEAGVKFTFSTGSGSNARHVPYHAALAVAYGLPAEAAMQSLTIWAAEIWGVEDQLGSIEVGKMANLFVTDGDPLDIRTNVSEIFIKGRRVPGDDRATRLYEKHNARPKNNN